MKQYMFSNTFFKNPSAAFNIYLDVYMILTHFAAYIARNPSSFACYKLVFIFIVIVYWLFKTRLSVYY